MDTDNTILSKYEVDLQASQSQSCAEEREKRKYVLQQKKNNRGCHPASTSDSVERIPFSNTSSVSTTNVERRKVYHLSAYATPNISSNLFHSSTQVKDNTISSKCEVDLQAIQRQMCAEEREKRKYILQQKRNNRGCHPASTSDYVERIPFSNTSNASTNNVERRNAYHLPTYVIPDISSNVCHSSTNEKDSSRKISSRNVHHTPFGSTKQISNFVERTPLSDITNCGISKIELQMSDEMLPDSVSVDYIDHGDAIFVCSKCDAMLWEDEMLRGNKKRNKTSYSLCCSNGDVELPRSPTPPPLLRHLYKSHTSQSRNFMDNIRAYNMMFSFTSLGGKVDKSYQRGKGPYVFRLQGQNYHRMGSLLPEDGEEPRFSQLYIYDSQNEVVNRQKVVSSLIECKTTRNNQLDSTTIQGLKDMLDSCNPLVQSFGMVRDCFQENEFQDVSLKLIGIRDKDGRVHNLPTASEIAALINGDFDGAFDKRDIVVRKKVRGLQRISELHPSYLALQYPLIFPHAEDGYRVGIKHRGTAIDNEFLVDGYTMIESARLNYIRTQQPKLRAQSLKNLNATVESGENNASSCGKPILLPSLFTGASRYMMQKYLDAMAICKSVGYPDLFITVTCNPNWPEIYRCLHDKALNAEDRPDIISRLFKCKLDHLIKDFKKHKFFGDIQAAHCSKISVMYTVEFQKRGLPHAHMCLFLGAESKFPTASDIDRVISAEIPDKERDPALYELVKQFMIHGPCGTDNPLCPCMVQQKCSKKFPKNYVDETCVDSEGYPVYHRHQTSNTVVKNDVTLDNRFVVPYNALLLRKYWCHVNVEWCNQSGSIKYLFKYISKGPDRVTASVFQANSTKNDTEQNVVVDEIKAYLDCRYIPACEAAWRIFMYDIHYRYPAVEVLPFHCEDGQSIVYNDHDNLCDIVTDPTVKMIMITKWMNCNKVDEFARTLRYVQFPGYYVWNAKNRKWNRRKNPYGSIGRIHYVPPSLGDCYYLRILLNHIKGPTCCEDIKTVDRQVFQTFKDACFARGLLDDDKEYVNAIKEASTWSTGDFLRTFFVMLLLSNSISRPGVFWSETKSLLCEDILYQQRKITVIAGNVWIFNKKNLKISVYLKIEKLLLTNGSTVRNFDDMPSVPDNYVSSSNNRLIMKELSYDRLALQREHDGYVKCLTAEQERIYKIVMEAIEKGDGGVFFVYGYGGTGKTFLWKTFSAALRSKGEVVLNVASSGIASLLLDGGRTAHSRFVIPININENSICSIEPNTELGDLIKRATLIIWDEAPMTHKHCFEALDRTMRDISRSSQPNMQFKPFGGKVILFGGDFRQILSVIPKGTRTMIVNASLNSSYIWRHCQVLKLTKNMRLRVGCQEADLKEIKEFGEWI
ncbi:uncharacterized protein LOC110869606 [Helianthus annuus]|uniref:uncharacterized protein LOC110869606 n=1 Tax=Helianthus annuus TaxID=4232 RepID=UPI000B8FD8EF|nr:uncharacterized protein LOC110869606 [Helianthus annuus]